MGTRTGKGDVGCDNKLCQVKVCECDPYCCLLLWDSSCSDANYFFPGCSASELCCPEGSDVEVEEELEEVEDELEESAAPANSTLPGLLDSQVTEDEELPSVISTTEEEVIVVDPISESDSNATLPYNKNFSYFYL